MTTLRRGIVILALAAYAAAPLSAVAAPLLADWEAVPLGEFTAQLYIVALQVVGLAVFVMFLIAGLSKMIPGLRQFTGDPWDIVKDAVIGLIILVSAYVILNSINPALVGGAGASTQSAPSSASSGSPAGSAPNAALPASANSGTSSVRSPINYVIEQTTSDGVSYFFLQSGAPCSAQTAACRGGYSCQGAVCTWAGDDQIPLHAYCSLSTQCAGSASCVDVYEFRDQPGRVRKCCNPDEIETRIDGSPEYCRN